MTEAYICDPIRTDIGRYAGALSSIRPDDAEQVVDTLYALCVLV